MVSTDIYFNPFDILRINSNGKYTILPTTIQAFFSSFKRISKFTSFAKLNATQILRLLLQIIFLHLLLHAYDIITLLSNQTKKISLAKLKGQPISFNLNGILG